MILPKKQILTFFVLILTLLSGMISPPSVFAEGEYVGDYDVQQGNQNRQTIIDAAKNDSKTVLDGQVVGEYQTKAAIFNTINLVVCTDPNPKYCNSNQTAMGNITSLMAALFQNPPASLAWYIRDALANAGLIKPVQAQGIGFVALSPFLPLWKATRNIAYAVLIIVMIAIGFMIIFRMKIDPKTVISVQAALPKIILTLIIITFSYAIVGFLVDIMYLSMAILISIMANGMGGEFARNVDKLQTQYMTGGWNVLLASIFSGGFRALDDFLKTFWGIIPGGTGIGVIIGALPLMSIPWGAFVGGAVISLLFLLIVVLGLLFTFIRLLMLLFNSYMQVLIAVIIGPIQLLTEAIPGRSAFSGWILNILANLVVFPATAAILMFAMFLTSSNITESVWTPPLIGAGASVFQAFLGLSIIFIAPGLVASVKKLFHAKPALPVTAGTAISPLTSSAQTAMGAASQFYYLKMTGQGLPVIGKFFGQQGQRQE